MDWNSGLQSVETNEFKVLPIGEYHFSVLSLEKAKSKAGNPLAKLRLGIIYENHVYTVYDSIALIESCAWKLQSFFESLGLMTPGEALEIMPWDRVEGMSGVCRIFHEDYNGRTYPKIDRYVPCDASEDEVKEEKSTEATDAPESESEATGELPFEI